MTPQGAATCYACSAQVLDVARFCSNCGVRLDEATPDPTIRGGEHRQITVMFCDLVGSTTLSQLLEPEDLQTLIRRYQSICARAVEARGGMIAKYQGDGVMAYFGFPVATEEAATNAVDAGLDIVREMRAESQELKHYAKFDFSTRIALHTGRVLISEMGAGATRERNAVTGIVPNLAARLEQCAPRNGVAISAQTRALVMGAFSIKSLGKHDLKGFPEPIEVFSVEGRRAATTILPAAGSHIEGREHELATLSACWHKAQQNGTARVALIADPGIGKSTLASAFMAADDIRPANLIELSGAISDRHTAFTCLRKTLQRWTSLGEARSGLSPERLISGWFGKQNLDESTHAQVLYKLWSGQAEPGAEGRTQIFEAARRLVREYPKPLLAVIEDAHWVDPSTLELIEQISVDTEGLMLLMLSRPGGDAALIDSCDHVIKLSTLDADASKRLSETVAGGPVENGLARKIHEVAGGVPLFVVEYTKSLIDAAQIHHERGMYRSPTSVAAITTPASLLDILTVRLDALGPVKEFAQICAVLGRSFGKRALAAVSQRSGETLDLAITRLTDAGLLVREWNGQYAFQHALFQKAAYESLVRAARQHWHKRYLDWLDDDHNSRNPPLPEIVGFHLEACGRTREAVDHYLEAGLSANGSSASLEALAHFTKCLDLLADTKDEDDDTLNLRVQVLRAGALLSARGPGAVETRAAYDEAIKRAEITEESEWHFAAYWGWWRVSDTFATMSERAKHLLSISDKMQGAEFKLQAMHCVWANAFQMGELDASIDNAQAGLTLYDAGGFADHGTLYGGHDCKVCALGEIALAGWLKGGGDAVQSNIDAAISHAQNLEHLGSLLHALDIGVMLHLYRRDIEAVQNFAMRLLELGSDHDLEDYRAKGGIFLGWVDVERGLIRHGLKRINDNFEIMQAVGTPEDFPVYQCIRAAAFNSMGDYDAARDALSDGRSVIVSEGVSYWGAEIARMEAETEMARPQGDAGFIRERLIEAQELARAQGALALELRSAMSRIEFAQHNGCSMDVAVNNLRDVRERFAVAVTGRDLAEADEILSPKAAE